MLVKELKEDYPLVYEAALKNSRDKNEFDSLERAFTWDDSPEYGNFWSAINNRKFNEAKEICPELFEAQNKKKENLVGRYLKVIKDNAHGTDYSKDHYTLIKKEISYSSVRDENNMDFSHRNYNFKRSDVELMPEGFTPMEVIQKQCKEKYPIGCKFRSLNGNEYTLEEDNVVYSIVGNNIWTSENQGLLYSDGDWAELLKLPEDEESLLKEAERRYPIGTKYKDAESKSSNSINNRILTAEYKPEIVVDSNIEVGRGYVYYNGKWADIVEESFKPKPSYINKVVHVDTQEKWDFVLKKEKITNLHTNTWRYHKQNSCIFLNKQEYSRLDFYKKNNYQIISFEEYLSLNVLEHELGTFDELEVDYSNYFKKDEWYVIELNSGQWLFQFNRVEGNRLYDSKCIDLNDLKKYNDDSNLTTIDRINSARLATREEVEKYYPDEFKFKSNTTNHLLDVFQSSKEPTDVPVVRYPEYYKELYSRLLVPEQAYIEDKFMEPIKVKPYKKSKNKIKLIFNK